MFARLLSHPGVREDLELRSGFGFLAFHGGSLERYTDLVAGEAAARAGASYYGLVQPPEFRWHIPSNRVDPADSERLAAFLDHVEVAVAVHGYGRAGLFTTLLLGGRNRPLAHHLGAVLRRRLGHYRVLDDLDEVPVDLRGLHADNPVNRPRQGGVQLELPPRVRGMGPYWHDWGPQRPNPHTEALIAALAEAAGTWEPGTGDRRTAAAAATGDPDGPE
jgi:phage replication-related protein YjqB (UPF0714/DUF867 family)